MFTKSHLLGTLGGFLILFLGGWLYYAKLTDKDNALKFGAFFGLFVGFGC